MHRTRKQLVLDGFIAGLLGYAAVVLLFAFVNLASMRGVFATPEALGRAILGTTDRAAGPGGAMAPVLAFNGLHLLVSLALGMLVAFLAEQAEIRPRAGLRPGLHGHRRGRIRADLLRRDHSGGSARPELEERRRR